MTVCELCSQNESCGLFLIKDSHILEDRFTQLWLCYWCAKELQSVHSVRLKLVKGVFKPQRVSFPIKQKVFPIEPKT